MAAKTKRSRNQEIKALDLEADEQKQVDELRRPQVEPNDSGTRQQIAKYFVIAYFGLFTLLIIGLPLFNLWAYSVTHSDRTLQIPFSDTIQNYSAIVGPTLGFVIGYYFKNKSED